VAAHVNQKTKSDTTCNEAKPKIGAREQLVVNLRNFCCSEASMSATTSQSHLITCRIVINPTAISASSPCGLSGSLQCIQCWPADRRHQDGHWCRRSTSAALNNVTLSKINAHRPLAENIFSHCRGMTDRNPPTNALV
jgi:hypothetical protein